MKLRSQPADNEPAKKDFIIENGFFNNKQLNYGCLGL